MKALVFADQTARGLAPLTDRTCAALLPVAGRSLLDHALDALEAAGIEAAIVVASPFAAEVERHLKGAGKRKLAVEVSLSRGDETLEDAIARLGERLPPPFLAVRCDVLRTPSVADFLERARRAGGTGPVAAKIGGVPGGLLLVREKWAAAAGDPWQGAEAAGAVDLRSGRAILVDTLPAFHRANIEAAFGKFPGLVLPAREAGAGILVGRHSRVPPSSVKGPPAFAGPRCQVHPEADLRGDVVLSGDVFVDRGATLKSAVVLPRSYVGELVEVQNAIVWSDLLIRVDTGSVARVTDSFLLSELSEPVVAPLLGGLLDRLAGLLLLVLSIPLWPVVFLASLGGGFPLRTVRLRGNRQAAGGGGRSGNRPVRREFSAVEARTAVPVLRHLPNLVAVVSGDLSLVGVPPLSAAEEDALTEEWERLRLEVPAGLVGPTQLTVPAGAPTEEERLTDAFYAKTRTRAGDLVWLLRGAGALFSGTAWARPPAEGG